MFHKAIILTGLLATTVLGSPVVANVRNANRLDKPVLSPQLPDLSKGLEANLNFAYGEIARWVTHGYEGNPRTNEVCQSYWKNNHLAWEDLWHFNATYRDCLAMSWNGCFHSKAELDPEDIFQIWGMIPVQMRSYTRHLIVLPAEAENHSSKSSAVWNDRDDIYIKGRPSMHEFLVAVAKSADLHGFPGIKDAYHNTTEWLEAYNKDSAVPSTIAQISQAENIAVHIAIALFDIRVPGGISSVLPGWRDIGNQQKQITKAAHPDLFGLHGAPKSRELQCNVTDRRPNSPWVIL
ncbi:hypothetical protein BU24DRAFT_485210 [Aaosphaeria arxii CBS 175.79]|uniref:Uncharacterized protein n=1 Tax=Aaosphaeria arxii CBS 175.79 TaxID=1450172 RepID=A0A6A5XG46_9PLEO|nr:uncharacterized protein BU24DRAFT_485210 [Aaosphaeria arxii CBS 175.79]KAF2011903.1 hypothetical protein BU24DRAFT_485210 [Aaosphaeria arxii CBS 175.79]